MPSANMDGKFTITQVLNFTKQEFPSRFDNAKRDKVRMIRVKSIQYYSKDRPNLPTVKYEVISQSTPNYPPYTGKDKRGRKRYRQHSIRHEYDTIFQFGSEGITLSTKKWRSATGSLRKIPENVPQKLVGQIHRETSAKWKKKYNKEDYKKKIRSHKRHAKFISDGDYIASLGINLDFLYRQAYAYFIAGHLSGRNYNGNVPAKKTNPNNIVFFNKHQIILIKSLMQKGILIK